MQRLLDTDVCSYAMRGDPRVLEHLRDLDTMVVAISVITEAELRYGALRMASPRYREAVDGFVATMTVVPFTSADASTYGRLRVALERAGSPIGKHDMLIAAQAVTHGLVLVTNNERELRRVPGLRIENWVA